MPTNTKLNMIIITILAIINNKLTMITIIKIVITLIIITFTKLTKKIFDSKSNRAGTICTSLGKWHINFFPLVKWLCWFIVN